MRPGTNTIDLAYGASGLKMGFFDGTGAYWWNDHIWSGDRLLGDYDAGTTYFFHLSTVGSSSPTQLTGASGGPSGDEIYYPWGQEWKYDNVLTSWYQFYGSFNRLQYDLDLYLTPNRFYSSGLGRWLSPDKLGGDVTNPQSLNRYAYVLNNPATLNDPLGLQPGESGGGVSCRDPQYAESHAECQGPGSPWCFEDAITGSPCWTGTLGFSGGGGPVGASGTATSAPPAGQPLLGGGYVGSGGEVGPYVFLPPGVYYNTPLGEIISEIVLEEISSALGRWLAPLGAGVGTFFSNFVSSKFYNEELSSGGCLNTFGQGVEQADILAPLGGSANIVEDTIQGTAGSMAVNYAASVPLVVPFRSSVVRSILGTGETYAGAFAPGYADFLEAYGFFGKEVPAMVRGTCH